MITAEDILLFEKHLELYTCLKKHSYIRNYTKETYNELVGLYIKYVSPTHSFSHWCSSCRAELVHFLYSWYEANAPTNVYSEDVPVLEPTEAPIVKRTRKTKK